MLRGAIWERLGLQHLRESFHGSFGNLYFLTKRYRPIMIYHIKNCELAESLQRDWKFNLHRNILIEWLYFLSFLWRENTDKNPRSNDKKVQEPTTNSTYMWYQVRESNPSHGRERLAPSPPRHRYSLGQEMLTLLYCVSRQLSIWGEKIIFIWSL